MIEWLKRQIYNIPFVWIWVGVIAVMAVIIWLLMTLTGAEMCGGPVRGSDKSGWSGGICFR